MTSSEKNIFTVNIYGTDYPVRGDVDAEYIQKVAEFVDNKMRQIDHETSVKSSLKVAILAALNITDELFKERAEKEQLMKQFEEKIVHMIDHLNRTLSKEKEQIH